MKIKSLLFVIIGIIIFSSCGNNSGRQSAPFNTQYGKPVGMVQLWTIDSSGAEPGSAAFELYKDSGNYYVKFLNRHYRLSRTRPFRAGDAILTYEFTSVEGYQYYLEDVTDEDTWFFRL